MAYQPSGSLTTSSQFTHLATVWYNRTGLDVLRKKFRFRQVCEPDQIPLRSGKTVQWYRYGTFAANTTPAPEGTVTTPIVPTTATITATVSEYADFSSVSTLLQETAIDPIVENHSRELSYRAGLSADTIARIEFDSTTTPELNTLGAAMTVGDYRRVRALLNGIDLDEGPNGMSDFVAIQHPYVMYDVMSDNTAGGFIDIAKYANAQALLDGEVGKIDKFRIVTSTNVKTSGTAPNVLYYNYMVGRGAVGAVDLPGVGPTNVEDPNEQSFKINVVKGGPNPADPEGMIGSYVSYRFVTVNKILDATNYRYKMVKADASLV